jgi:hypothetical protein
MKQQLCISVSELASDSNFQMNRKFGLMIGYKNGSNAIVSQVLETPTGV